MREPKFLALGEEQHKPLSQLPVAALKRVAGGNAVLTPGGDEDADMDFLQRYAAILLRERGF